jgi:hypothetical protein
VCVGRIDATGGRGSYAGLDSCLQAVVESVQPVMTALTMAAYTQTETTEAHNTLRICVCAGVWDPVAKVLSDRFAGMFSIGEFLITVVVGAIVVCCALTHL